MLFKFVNSLVTISDDSTTDTIHIFAENILVNVDNIKILGSIDDEMNECNHKSTKKCIFLQTWSSTQ